MEMRRWKAAGLTTLLATVLLATTATQASAGGRPSGREPTPTAKISSPVDPGVDPPYDPHELEDLKAPWSPPQGPGGLSAPEEGTRPDGPDDRKPPETRDVPDLCVGGKMMDWSYEHQEYLPSYGWRAYLWLYEDQVGGKVALADWAPVGPTGEWQYCPPSLAGWGNTFAYTYVATNQWIQLNDEQPDDYVGPVFWSRVAPGLPPVDGGIYPDAPVLDHWDGQLAAHGLPPPGRVRQQRRRPGRGHRRPGREPRRHAGLG